MLKGLSKDFVFLFGGIVLSFALESERGTLGGMFSSDFMSLLCLCLFVGLTGFYLAFRHYHRILSVGTCHPGSPRRIAYTHLRASLIDGGSPAQIYARWLEKALRMVERFFGDNIPERATFMQRAIGLQKPAALWSAPALDWCILFAFIYPQAFLILGWVITGQAGVPERVLGLAQQPSALPRYVTLGAIALAVIGYAKCSETLNQPARETTRSVRAFRFALWLSLLIAASLTIDALLNHGKGAIGGSVILTSSVVGVIAGDVLIAVLAGFVGAAAGIAAMLMFGEFGAAIVAAIAAVLIGLLHAAFGGEHTQWMRMRDRLRHSIIFWWFFLVCALCLDIGFARLLPPTDAWGVMGPVLLFYGLLPALNAPFLWFSVGMTRALLWLGLERKGWWPYFYALLDAASAVLVLVLLVGAIVVGVQTLDMAAESAGAKPLLSVAPLLDAVIEGFRTKSFKAEYWWLYTLMLSGTIPSLLNLVAGGFSLVRGIPFVSRYLHARLPDEGAVPSHERNWVALLLSVQVVAGMGLAALAQLVLLPWWIFGYVLPGLGLGIIQFAQSIEALNLPAQIFH